jgi:hypothetical protein
VELSGQSIAGATSLEQQLDVQHPPLSPPAAPIFPYCLRTASLTFFMVDTPYP